MAYERFSPLNEAISLRDAVDSLLRESFIRPGGDGQRPNVAGMPLDVIENNDAFMVRAVLPGVSPDDVDITIHGEVLTVRAEAKQVEQQQGETWHLREIRQGEFRRTVSLGTPVDSDKAEARFEDGILTLTVPKAEQAKPRQIKVGRA